MKDNRNKKSGSWGMGCLVSILAVFSILLVVCIGGIGWKIENMMPKSSVSAEQQKTETAKNVVEGQQPEEANNTVKEQQPIQNEKGTERVTTQSSGSNNNFETYNNPSQQETTSPFVLNTSTNKVHIPGCRDVKKIAPENYAVSDEKLEDILAQNYTRCGHCLE